MIKIKTSFFILLLPLMLGCASSGVEKDEDDKKKRELSGSPEFPYAEFRGGRL